jgi:hypothetical protein
MAPTHDSNGREDRMGELEKQPFVSEIREPLEPHVPKPERDDSTSVDRPASNWEGYSIEILSIWFDP